MKKENNFVPCEYKESIGVFFIVLAGLIIRLILLLVTSDFHGVSAGKTLLAKLILENGVSGSNWYVPVHPPLHLLFIISGLKLFYFPLLVPRLISLFFGIALFLPYYYTIKKIFNKRVAVYSLIGISLYSQHIIYSVIGTSETCFHFFLFLSLLFAILFYNVKKNIFLFLSALAIGLSSLCRYEGLLFIPLMVLFLKENNRAVIVFFLVSIIMPLLWMVVSYRYGGNALHFISTNDINVPLQFNWIRSTGIKIALLNKIWFWPNTLLNTLGIPMFIFGFLGVLFCLVKREKLFFAGMFLIILAIFVLRTVQEKLYLQPRYSITLGLMLIPFAVFIFIKIIDMINRKIPYWIVLLLLWTMIPAIGKNIFAEPLYAPEFAKNIARYMKNNITKGENIIMDHCGDEKFKEPIKLLSGINPKQFVLTPYMTASGKQLVFDKKVFFDNLEKENIQILIYSPYGNLGSALALEKQGAQAKIDGFYFHLVYTSGPYYIYRVEKLKES